MTAGPVVVQLDRCPSCGARHDAGAACAPGQLPEIEILASGPCNCLPAARSDWVECAHCGLPQAPGKAFCSFCGHRWVTAHAG